MTDLTQRLHDLENVLHLIKGYIEDGDMNDPRWAGLHLIVSDTLEKAPFTHSDMREQARWYLRDYIHFPLNTRTGDDFKIQNPIFGDDPQWHVTPPPLDANDPRSAVYTIAHKTGLEFKFNYYELTGDAST